MTCHHLSPACHHLSLARVKQKSPAFLPYIFIRHARASDKR